MARRLVGWPPLLQRERGAVGKALRPRATGHVVDADFGAAVGAAELPVEQGCLVGRGRIGAAEILHAL